MLSRARGGVKGARAPAPAVRSRDLQDPRQLRRRGLLRHGLGRRASRAVAGAAPVEGRIGQGFATIAQTTNSRTAISTVSTVLLCRTIAWTEGSSGPFTRNPSAS